MKTPKNADYDVGYGKPPEHSKFKAGESGNPKGRPKGSLNLATAVNRALREKVIVVENGKRKAITKLDATIKGLVNSAVKGDAKARQQLLGLAPMVGYEAAMPMAALDTNDAAVMADLIKRMAPKPAKAPSTPAASKRTCRPTNLPALKGPKP